MDIELLKKEFAKDYPDAIWNHQTNNWHEEHHRRSWWPYKAGYERASLANNPQSTTNDLELSATMQFIGFHHAEQGYSVIDLARSMGLTSEELEAIADDPCVIPYVDELRQHFQAITKG